MLLGQDSQGLFRLYCILSCGERVVLAFAGREATLGGRLAEFLRSLVRHGLSGGNLVISDAHEGQSAAM